MKIIKEKVSNTIIIEKSKFITYLIPLQKFDDIERIINEYRKMYSDATHVCYGYIYINNGVEMSKCYDDGEPSSTAGNPILSYLKIKKLNNVICLVIRYFGGIKLGAGGLIRAYGNSTLEAINKASIVDAVLGYHYLISFSYNNVKLMDKYLNSIQGKVLNKKFELKVIYEIVLLENNDIDNLINYFANEIEIKKLEPILITL